jgi:hypothetical protein
MPRKYDCADVVTASQLIVPPPVGQVLIMTVLSKCEIVRKIETPSPMRLRTNVVMMAHRGTG